MRSRDAVTVAIIVLAVVAIAAVALHDDGPEWRISYDTGGGVLPDWAPSGYDTWDVMELPEPEKDGFVFMGWEEVCFRTGPPRAMTPGMSSNFRSRRWTASSSWDGISTMGSRSQ